MIKDIEEKSKTKFSIEVEFSFSFKEKSKCSLEFLHRFRLSVILKYGKCKADLRLENDFKQITHRRSYEYSGNYWGYGH